MSETWTDERIETLTSMWNGGITADRTAKALGLTRNAVIGKVYRLGLPKRPRSKRRKEARPRKKHSARFNYGMQVSINPEKPLESAMNITDYDPPMKERVDISALTDKTCRYPIGNPGDEEFRYCGKPVDPGKKPYCTGHGGICYRGAPAANPLGLPRRKP